MIALSYLGIGQRPTPLRLLEANPRGHAAFGIGHVQSHDEANVPWNDFASPGLGRSSSMEANMDHTAHIRLTSADLTPEVLDGSTIYGPGDETIGRVSHVHGLGADTIVVIDVGGFLGIGAKPVAVKVADLNFMRDEEGEVHAVTSWTKDQLKSMPEHRD
jgi:hypothetical protein